MSDCLGVVALNLCRSCGRDFSSLSAFDRHRVGSHEQVWSLDALDGRRCMAVDEMVENRMELDPRGRWRVAMSDADRQRLRGWLDSLPVESQDSTGRSGEGLASPKRSRGHTAAAR